MSIVGCAVCEALPQKYRSEEYLSGVRALAEIAPDFRKCPRCGTCYAYSEIYDRGEPMVPESTTYCLIRYNLAQARRVLPAEVESRYAAGIAELTEALFGTVQTSLHVRKYLIESVTDDVLQARRWDELRRLLNHPDPVVRVETAGDVLFVATEEHPVWCIREFDEAARKAAREFLAAGGANELVPILARELEEPAISLDHDSTLGYREVPVSYNAMHCLQNAQYRKLDLTPAIPALVKKSQDRDRIRSGRAMELLKALETSAEGARLISEERVRQGISPGNR